MKRILYDTGPRVVARWSRERILKLSNLVLVKRPPTPPKNGKKGILLLGPILGTLHIFSYLIVG